MSTENLYEITYNKTRINKEELERSPKLSKTGTVTRRDYGQDSGVEGP